MLKKIFISVCLLLIPALNCFGAEAKYKNSETISLNDFLQAKEAPDNWKHLARNRNGDVTYRNRVILTESGQTINDDTAADSYLLLKILLLADGAQPRENCDTSDFYNNGIYGLGCYIDNPDE